MSDEASAGLTDKTAQQIAQTHINQSVAQAVQSAADLLQSISSIEATVIGVASAKWLAEPANPGYEKIIENATKTITFAADNLATVGKSGADVLNSLKP